MASLAPSEFDNPLGEGTGAAILFGATGGVMEAALRTAYELSTGRRAACARPRPPLFPAHFWALPARVAASSARRQRRRARAAWRLLLDVQL